MWAAEPSSNRNRNADPIDLIREEGLERSQAMETLTYLSDVIGPRLTGLLTTIPLYITILTVFAHRDQGPAAAAHVLRRDHSSLATTQPLGARRVG